MAREFREIPDPNRRARESAQEKNVVPPYHCQFVVPVVMCAVRGNAVCRAPSGQGESSFLGKRAASSFAAWGAAWPAPVRHNPPSLSSRHNSVHAPARASQPIAGVYPF